MTQIRLIFYCNNYCRRADELNNIKILQGKKEKIEQKIVLNRELSVPDGTENWLMIMKIEE